MHVHTCCRRTARDAARTADQVAQLLEATAGLEAEEALVRLLAMGALDHEAVRPARAAGEWERLVRRGAGAARP